MVSEQEGWFTDPYGRHEARWISGGVPSKLVRDGSVESYDDPPDTPPAQAWEPIEAPPDTMTAADTLRADAAEAETMPSLAELNRREVSAAITTEAHPWFVARNFVRPSRRLPRSATPMSRALSPLRLAALIVGGIVAGFLLAASSYGWIVQGGVPFALAAPIVTLLFWFGDRRAKLPLERCIERIEVVGGLLGVLSFLILASA